LSPETWALKHEEGKGSFEV